MMLASNKQRFYKQVIIFPVRIDMQEKNSAGFTVGL